MDGMNKLLGGVAVLAALGLAWEFQKAEPIEATARADATASEAPEGGIGIGETALLGDGAARVFLSGVSDGSARIAVNGFDTQTLAVGESAAAGDCSVTLDAIGGGKARFGYNCNS